MQDFKKLRVWHLAHLLSIRVIRALPVNAARKVPGLRSQAIRAATSVPWNIAEGCRRSSRKEQLHYSETALSSLGELEAQLITARDTFVVSLSTYESLEKSLSLVRRMLISFNRTLERSIAEEEEEERKRRHGTIDEPRPTRPDDPERM
jgi:four helix bundle protein